MAEETLMGAPVQKSQAPLVLGREAEGTLQLTIRLSSDQKLLELFPSKYTIETQDGDLIQFQKEKLSGEIKQVAIDIPFKTGKAGAGVLEVHAFYGFCSVNGKQCVPRDVTWRVPFQISEGGTAVIELEDKP